MNWGEKEKKKKKKKNKKLTKGEHEIFSKDFTSSFTFHPIENENAPPATKDVTRRLQKFTVLH